MPAALAALLLAGCGDMGDSPGAPPPEAPAGPSMLGSVVLVADLADDAGAPAGTTRIQDASGVRVYCRHEGGEVDSAFTEAGRFVFRGIPAGACTVFVKGPDARRADEVLFPMPEHDCSLTDVLELAPAGDLTICPNPAGGEGAAIQFSKTGGDPYRVSVRDLSDKVVWSYEQAAPPGHYHVHWVGIDQGGEPVEPGPYWVRVEADGGAAYGVLLWGGGSGPDSANCGHVHADGVALTNGEVVLAVQTNDRVDGELLVAAGAELSARMRFVNEDGSLYAIADTCAGNSLEWEVADTSIAEISLEPGTKWGLRIAGRAPGVTSAVFRVIHEEHAHLTTLPVPIRVE